MLIIFGSLIVLAGSILVLLERFGLPQLPGDIVIGRENHKLYLPFATSILISVVLSLILYLVTRFFR
jgi:hypothetical protein